MDIVTFIPELREPTKVAEDPDEVLEVAKTLFAEMEREREGIKTIGLAANQLGFDLRICVMRLINSAPICLVNPVITKEKGHTIREETCLSLPGVEVRIRRPQILKVKALNQYMKPRNYTFTGFFARIACHEIDHLDGKLITDYQ